MKDLNDKIEELEELIKSLKKKISSSNVLPSIKPLKTDTKPRIKGMSTSPKMPGMPSASKKNPVKQAEQVKNNDIKDMKMREAREALNVNKSTGQWEINKAESAPERKGSYHGEAYVLDTTRGTRHVAYPKEDGTFGHRKVPNKIRITHVWDAKDKKWNHKSTVNLHDRKPTEESSYKTPMSVAHEKAKNAEKPQESKKPKTIRRAKETINKRENGQWFLEEEEDLGKPFKSEAQRRWMWAAADRGEVPKSMPHEWAKHTPKNKKLPKKVKKDS